MQTSFISSFIQVWLQCMEKNSPLLYLGVGWWHPNHWIWLSKSVGVLLFGTVVFRSCLRGCLGCDYCFEGLFLLFHKRRSFGPLERLKLFESKGGAWFLGLSWNLGRGEGSIGTLTLGNVNLVAQISTDLFTEISTLSKKLKSTKWAFHHYHILHMGAMHTWHPSSLLALLG